MYKKQSVEVEDQVDYWSSEKWEQELPSDGSKGGGKWYGLREPERAEEESQRSSVLRFVNVVKFRGTVAQGRESNVVFGGGGHFKAGSKGIAAGEELLVYHYSDGGKGATTDRPPRRHGLVGHSFK